MPDPNHRGYYRIVFPKEERPVLRVGEGRLEVLDCSESGLGYALPDAETPPSLGTVVRGRVRFHGGDEVDIDGTVVRVGGGSVAIHLRGPAIPYATVFAEQRRLRREYLVPRGSRR